ncbi:MAG: glycosyltransferase family protein [Ignavibacterium sp.]|nr:MAG: glycosyltransferase family protein [Ignavibacterium sp.]
MGSTRLPNKVMMPLADKPLLLRLYERVIASELAGTVVVATTTNKLDNDIVKLCVDNKLNYYRGNETDLLDRHYKAALDHSPTAVVKIPSDCPLIDPSIIDKVLKYYIDNQNNFDFVSNLHPPSYPDGNDVEVISMKALKDAWQNAERDYEREHTTPYFWENPDKFNIGNILWETGKDYSVSHRFTIDYPEDYQFIKQVYNELFDNQRIFTLEDILDLLERKPELMNINSKYAGVNWYRNHLDELKIKTKSDTRTT